MSNVYFCFSVFTNGSKVIVLLFTRGILDPFEVCRQLPFDHGKVSKGSMRDLAFCIFRMGGQENWSRTKRVTSCLCRS